MARLSITAGKDNYNGHISGILLSDHSDLLGDDQYNIGDHGAIIGGAYHVVTGSHAGIVAGRETQLHAMYGFMGGGDANILGNQNNSGDSSHSAMIGGYRNEMNGRYSVGLAGLDNTVEGQFSAYLGGWNNTVGSNVNTFAMAAIGGLDNVVLAQAGVTVGGQGNRIEQGAINSVATGSRARAKEISSKVHASGRFSTDGDAQVEEIVGFGAGTANVNVQIAGGGDQSLKAVELNEVVSFRLNVVGSRIDVKGEHYVYRIEGLAFNVNGVPEIGVATVTNIYETHALYNPTIFVLNGKIGLNIAGDASKTTRFVCKGEFVTLRID